MSASTSSTASAANLPDRLASILGPDRITNDPVALARYTIDEIIPSAVAKPATAAEAAEVVRFALKENLAIIPCGSRSKLQIGNIPSRYDIALDMSPLNQIALYDPGDLTISLDAGCTLKTISDALTPQNQFLPLPTAFGENATIAGTIASGVDSHLRQFFGTARDFLIGAEFIDGTGAQCKSGGRVVKNVTGYDLHKLLIGSLGTLAIITRLNFRTFPALNAHDSQTATFTANFPDAQSALNFRHKIAASVFTPDAIEILSPETVEILSTALARQAGNGSFFAPPLGPPPFSSGWNVVVLFHGTAELRIRHQAALKEFAQQEGANLSDAAASAVFSGIQHLRRASRIPVIFKITQLPTNLPNLLKALAEARRDTNIATAVLARGVGVVYFALLPDDPLRHLDQMQVQAGLTPEEMEPIVASAYQSAFQNLAAATKSVFAACAAQSAGVQLQFVPTQLKRHLSILGPDRPDTAAMRRLKFAFDPQNLFAPSRLL
jgi:FAD/FMN-containing dehydrogenase